RDKLVTGVQTCALPILEVIRKGHVPFIPHLTHYIHLETEDPLPVEFYYEYDMVWLQSCDALLHLGPSRGADRELEYAEKRGLKRSEERRVGKECSEWRE